jgi:tRNA threonylcarbamoyladenosine biosynthesis protein TsaB
LAWALGVPVTGVSTLEGMAGGAWCAWSGIENKTDSGTPVESQHADRAGASLGHAAGGKADGLATKDIPRRTGRVWIVPLLNARRGQAFTAWFERLPAAEREPVVGVSTEVYDTGWVRKREDGIRLVEGWTAEILEALRTLAPETRPDCVLFAGEPEGFGDETGRFAQQAEVLGTDTAVLPCGIHARYIGQLGAFRLQAGEADDTHGLLPNYTQLPEAEVKLLAKKS